MMCQFEGDIVNSLYDTFLISWGKPFPNPPGLPCLTIPTTSNKKFHFGDRKANVDHDKDGGYIEPTHMKNATEHAADPAHEVQEESEQYEKQDHAETANPINERLNVKKSAEQTADDHDTDFSPFYIHSPHDPVPMALVNRQPQAIPSHHDVHNPQNAAWLQGSPTVKFTDSSPQTCKEGGVYSIACL